MFIKYSSAFSADNCTNFWQSENFEIISSIYSDFFRYTVVTLLNKDTNSIIVITCDYTKE